MKYNLLFFTLILISNYSFSQILPSYHAVHYKPDGIVSDNLILHLDASNPNSINENDLSTWNDLTSNNNDLSLFSGTMQFSSDAGGSLVFDNDLYKRDSDLNNMSHTNITISMWVKTTVSSCYLSSLSRSLGSTGHYYEFVINIRGNGTFRFWDFKTGSSSPKYGFPTNQNNVSNTIINNGNWKFITFTKDNLTGKYYVNSSLDRTVTAYTNVNYGYDNFLIGKNWRDNNLPYNGSIGAVYLYTKTLSQNEITQNYNATKSRYGH
tara:strand:- start:119 stop:913 length:795 start_codon:yes stop_codon:yes gene_type:complete